MSTHREHPRRRRLLGLAGGQVPTPAQVEDVRQDILRSEAEPATLEAGESSVWGGDTLAALGNPDAIAAAVLWDRAASAEPYQVDVTRSLEDTTRMGNSLSAAVRLELLANSYREQVQDSRHRDPVSGAALDPVDGLPLPDVDEDQDDEDGGAAAQADPDWRDGSWSTLADLEASAAPLVYAAPAPAPEPHLTHSIGEDVPGLAAVPMAPAESVAFGGAPSRVLNWTSRHDPRSLEFGVRARLRAPAPLVDRAWPQPPILDQGTSPPLSLHDASGCTGHAAANAANVLELAAWTDISPVTPALLDSGDAMRLYERAQELDEAPGEDYPGTSILAVMKAGQEAGLWGTYLWAFGTRDVAQAILQVGPVIIGVPWLTKMAEPGPDGLVTVAGESLGGHALCLFAMRMKVAGRAGPFFGALQTWGPEVGDGGIIWFHHSDLTRLLRSRGEAAIPLPHIEAQ